MTSSSTSSSERMITVSSNDGRYFSVKKSVAVHSLTLKVMIEDGWCKSHPIFPLDAIDGNTLSAVLDYLNYKHDPAGNDNYFSSLSEDDRKKTLESRFVENKQFDELMRILFAANYLEIKDLLTCVATEMAKCMEGMSVEEVRKRFNVENDYTPEEEGQLLMP